MKVLLVNGSSRREGCTFTALTEVAGELERRGIEAEIFQLGAEPVRGCVACRRCHELKRCVFDDDVCNSMLEKMLAADGVIIGSPVYFAGANGALTAVLDRVFSASRQRFRYKPAAAVVSCRRGGASATFDRLNKYFTIMQMPIVASQYWNSVHGFTPDDVRKDLEGLQTMRTLAANMAWILESIAAGSGPKPIDEDPISTNFFDGL